MLDQNEVQKCLPISLLAFLCTIERIFHHIIIMIVVIHGRDISETCRGPSSIGAQLTIAFLDIISAVQLITQSWHLISLSSRCYTSVVHYVVESAKIWVSRNK